MRWTAIFENSKVQKVCHSPDPAVVVTMFKSWFRSAVAGAEAGQHCTSFVVSVHIATPDCDHEVPR